MNPNESPTLDDQAQSPARDRDETAAVEAREDEPASLTIPDCAPASAEPSPSERLYEAYRLWAFTGR